MGTGNLPPGLRTQATEAFALATRKPTIQFETRDVDPPSDVYISQDDGIVFIVRNSMAGMQLALRWRLLLANGELKYGQQIVQPTSDREQNVFSIKQAEGFLLSATVISFTSGVQRGQCFVAAFISRLSGEAPNLNQYLFADYVTSGSSTGWPGGNQSASIAGEGAILQYTPASSGAGVPLILGPPANARWKIISFLVTLNTGATVGNRRVYVTWGQVGTIAGITPAQSVQAASLSVVYSAAEYGSYPADVAGLANFILMPTGIIVGEGEQVTVNAVGLNGSDQFVTPEVLVEEWIEAAT